MRVYLKEKRLETLERKMQSDLIDTNIADFIGIIRGDVDYSTLIAMRGVLRADFQQLELAWKDLSDKIAEKDAYTEEEKDLFQNLMFTMVDIEEKCRLITEEMETYPVKDQF